MSVVTTCWQNTSKTLEDLKELMTCSLCSRLVEKPNVLGGCQHFFCKKCVDDYLIGESCPQCGMPSHAKDMMVNRQLNTAVLLVKQLDKLLKTSSPKGKDEVFTKPTTNTKQGESLQIVSKITSLNHLDSASNKENLKATSDENVVTKKRNDCISKSNNVGKETSSKGEIVAGNAPIAVLSTKGGSSGPSPIVQTRNSARSMRKRSAQYDVKGMPSKVPEGGSSGPNPEKKTDKRTKQEKRNVVPPDAVSCTSDKTEPSSSSAESFPRTRSGGASKNIKAAETMQTNSNPTRRTCSRSQATTAQKRNLSPRTASSPRSTPLKRGKNSGSKNSTPTSGRLSRQPWLSPSNTSTPRLHSGFESPGGVSCSPHVKKNARGETALHVACIKGDIATVRQLLEEDVAINVKDNAGWTPLHEAVNHGHVTIADILLDNGAFINVPGFDNDTPLHDAVQNGRVNCVKLLVKRGANKQARNIHGKTPYDLANTKVLRDALNVTVEEASTNEVLSQGSYPAYNQVVILATGLSREQKRLVAKCATVLHGKVVQDYSNQVTHVVTNVNKDAQCPRTIKYLQAVLSGKWILTLQWVETCIEYNKHVPEEAFEVPGASSSPNSQAPQRARINCQQQLPGLFDGCQFYFHGEINYPLPEKSVLTDLVKLGGATILNREPKLDNIDTQAVKVPYHAVRASQLENCGYFVVNDGKGVRSEMIGPNLCWTKASWLLNCIAQFKLLELE